MSKIVVAGAGAFGTALALTLDRAGRDVTLFARNASDIAATRLSPRLPDHAIPASIALTDKPDIGPDDVVLMAIPMQTLSDFLTSHKLNPMAIVACCKGVDLTTGKGPTALIEGASSAPAAILTGPSFADDLADGLPTALTLACSNSAVGHKLQGILATETLRIYTSDDAVGAELGGALKNVIAIACGICIGANLGESARAALMTRGFAEIQRIALALGARPETLTGLSGFGDLALTCTSMKSRNFRFGHALSAGGAAPNSTTEGKHTAKAVLKLAAQHNVEMPIAKTVADIIEDKISIATALEQLLNRPLKKE